MYSSRPRDRWGTRQNSYEFCDIAEPLFGLQFQIHLVASRFDQLRQLGARVVSDLLDELAIYPRALSEVEVSEHYWTMVSARKPEEGNLPKGNLGRTA